MVWDTVDLVCICLTIAQFPCLCGSSSPSCANTKVDPMKGNKVLPTESCTVLKAAQVNVGKNYDKVSIKLRSGFEITSIRI